MCRCRPDLVCITSWDLHSTRAPTHFIIISKMTCILHLPAEWKVNSILKVSTLMTALRYSGFSWNSLSQLTMAVIHLPINENSWWKTRFQSETHQHLHHTKTKQATGIFWRPLFIGLSADRPTGIIRRLTFSQIFYYLHIECTTKVHNTWTILTNHYLNLRATSTPLHAVNETVLIHLYGQNETLIIKIRNQNELKAPQIQLQVICYYTQFTLSIMHASYFLFASPWHKPTYVDLSLCTLLYVWSLISH